MNSPVFFSCNDYLPRALSRVVLLGWLSLGSSAVYSQGFVALPSTGFAVEGGQSAYTLCNDTGLFGSKSPNTALKPTKNTHHTCAIFPADEMAAPEGGFLLITHAVHEAIINNAYTGGISN